MKTGKRIVLIIWGFMMMVWLVLLYHYIANESMLRRYQQEKYDGCQFTQKLIFSITQPYLPHYNQGNVYYLEGEYDLAIEEYRKALTLHPTKEDECMIRINLALALLQQMDTTDMSETNMQEMRNIMNQAKEVLCEHGCAGEVDEPGHNETADKLKHDIEAFEKQLEESQQKNMEKDSSKEDEQNNAETEESQEKTDEEKKERERQEEELKKNQEESQKLRMREYDQSEQIYEFMKSDDFFYGDNW